MSWLDFPVTENFNPPTEFGIDIGTPFHTYLTNLFPGQVERVTYGPWGGEVDILTKVPGQSNPVTEYFLHLDEIFVKPGDRVTAGQPLGWTGGQLAGGMHPAQQPYSSGPHTEVGFFTGRPWASPSLDPRPILAQVGKGGPGDPFSGFAGDVGAGLTGAAGAVGAGVNQTAQAVSDLPAGIGHGLANFFSATESNVGAWAKRQAIAFFVAALVILVLFKLD